ncbi:MAG: Coenzyme F420 hydrogenase/dehydrogenase, beta subunit C-terminal domain [Clostridia bacterium]|nr:Coenzyme F420 hydrogenase/dehydrogenase, beta subunit C-terminal domain [Clostridia bacterium]
MIDYINSKDQSRCCGCRACEQVCPKGALAMKPNDEGFLYPDLDTVKCIHCGLCDKVCPMMNRPEGVTPKSIYAVQHNRDEVLENSSSGGVFRLLADYVIEQGGCVVGCVWSEGNSPILTIAETHDALKPMQGSKYLSSDTTVVYKKVKGLLENGKLVLFTGAPCQCAGLLTYLRKSYENLYTADFLCHGMPSQQIFDAYLGSIEKRRKGKVSDIKFRDKSRRGWGYCFSYFCNGKKYADVGMTNPYTFGFVSGYLNRYSCYSCLFTGEKRFTDFTFCDYWGYFDYGIGVDGSKGISAVSVNTERAVRLQQTLADQATWIPTKIDHVAAENPSILYEEYCVPPEIRRKIYRLVDQEGWEQIEKQYLRMKHYHLKKLWYMLPVDIARALKQKIVVFNNID